jgi:pimeloyl-ACP methyl ester carboxylesterase
LRVSVNSHNLYFEQNGPVDGPVVVLLHHGLGSVRAWREQVPALVEAGYRVLAYDRWGYGESEGRPGLDLPTFTTDLEDLRCFLDIFGIQHATLIGHSDGGTIALYFSAMYPEHVKCLVTVAAHIYLEPKMAPAIRIIKQAFEQDERFRKGMQSAHGEKYEEVFHNWFDGWHRSEVPGWDMRQVLDQIRCPSLIVQGEADEHASPQHAMDIATSIVNAELWLVAGAKHMVPQENSVEFNQKVLQFLKDHANEDQ